MIIMDKEKLETVLEERIEPFLDNTMKKFLGVRISEIKSDISDSILRSPLLGLKIEYSLLFLCKLPKRYLSVR